MFDFRYHVVSLAAVFLALVLGILVGVAISDPELDRRIDNAALREQVGRLQDDLDSAERRSERGQAAEDYVERTYEAVLRDRLAGKKVAVLFVGGADDGVEEAVEEVVDRAGGTLVRERAIQVPVADGIEQQLDPAESSPTNAGRALGREFVVGGETPTWDALEGQLVLQQSGSLTDEVDAVVVARTAEPQGGDTARFLRGVYEGLEGAVPAVGVEETGADPSLRPRPGRVRRLLDREQRRDARRAARARAAPRRRAAGAPLRRRRARRRPAAGGAGHCPARLVSPSPSSWRRATRRAGSATPCGRCGSSSPAPR